MGSCDNVVLLLLFGVFVCFLLCTATNQAQVASKLTRERPDLVGFSSRGGPA